ncbi:MAG TPA: hypothetical protein VIT38_06865 [Allosphingosinicella sp.]|jgi:hypothetical protein
MWDDWIIIPFGWPPRGSFRRWLAALGTVAALLLIFTLIFTYV